MVTWLREVTVERTPRVRRGVQGGGQPKSGHDRNWPREHFRNVSYTFWMFLKKILFFENRGITYEGRGVGGPFHGHFSFQADWGANHKKPFFLLGRGLLFDPKQQIICHVLSGRSLRYLYRSETFIFTFFQTCSLWQFCALSDFIINSLCSFLC